MVDQGGRAAKYKISLDYLVAEGNDIKDMSLKGQKYAKASNTAKEGLLCKAHGVNPEKCAKEGAAPCPEQAGTEYKLTAVEARSQHQ